MHQTHTNLAAKSLGHMHQHLQSPWHHINWPNWPIPTPGMIRKQGHHGNGWDRLKWHICWTHQDLHQHQTITSKWLPHELTPPARINPWKHVLDIKISTETKQLITYKYKMTYNLVLPGCHQCNAAKDAICNFKAHFVSILARVANHFVLQAKITINLLQQSNATPIISAYAHLNGPFDYNKMTLAPMWCKVQTHEKSEKCGTWAFHSIDR